MILWVWPHIFIGVVTCFLGVVTCFWAWPQFLLLNCGVLFVDMVIFFLSV